VLLIILIFSFVFAFIIYPIFIKGITYFNIFDSPGGRKIHLQQTPHLGGVVIFFSAISSILFGVMFQLYTVGVFFLISLIVMFLLGLRDDLYPLNYFSKLLVQLFAVLVLVLFQDIRITSAYGFLGIEVLPYWFSVLYTVGFMILTINAFNLIDGMDALSGSIATLVFICFAGWFYQAHHLDNVYISLVFLGATFAFLQYNWYPAKIFMGDTGSLLIGLVISILFVEFIEWNGKPNEGLIFRFSSPFSFILSMYILPYIDTFRVIIKRTMKGKHPLKADRLHLHHFLMRSGLSQPKSLLILIACNAFFILIAISGWSIADNVMVPLMVALAIAFCLVLEVFTYQSFKKRSKRKSYVS
jgi:UDP-GlcNAc:undecaprenyl-phosphate GlcNAc-1-phosphate transferase